MDEQTREIVEKVANFDDHIDYGEKCPWCRYRPGALDLLYFEPGEDTTPWTQHAADCPVTQARAILAQQSKTDSK